MRNKGQENKLGHQAPKGLRLNDQFNYVKIDGDLHYCASHDFVYNCELEEEKLHNGEACYYTDSRYHDGRHNYYKDCYLEFTRHFWGRKYTMSLKKCKRMVRKCMNIPVGTVVEFRRDWVWKTKKGNHIDMGYRYKVTKENPFDPKYQINKPSYERNFDYCEKSQELTDMLRDNGFLVSVNKTNPNFLMSMLATAEKYVKGVRGEDVDEGGQYAIAYGHGMRVGFSSGNETLMGYSNGCDYILYDYYNEFNKWSQCYEIPKDLSAEEIVKILIEESNNHKAESDDRIK